MKEGGPCSLDLHLRRSKHNSVHGVISIAKSDVTQGISRAADAENI